MVYSKLHVCCVYLFMQQFQLASIFNSLQPNKMPHNYQIQSLLEVDSAMGVDFLLQNVVVDLGNHHQLSKICQNWLVLHQHACAVNSVFFLILVSIYIDINKHRIPKHLFLELFLVLQSQIIFTRSRDCYKSVLSRAGKS